MGFFFMFAHIKCGGGRTLGINTHILGLLVQVLGAPILFCIIMFLHGRAWYCAGMWVHVGFGRGRAGALVSTGRDVMAPGTCKRVGF